jgi:hypothetical protein
MMVGYFSLLYVSPLIRLVRLQIRLLVSLPTRCLNWLWKRIKWRWLSRSKVTVDWTSQVVYRKGTWAFENGKLYLKVVTPSGIEMVSLENCDPHATVLFASQASKPVVAKETVLEGSSGVLAPLPKSSLLFYGDDKVLGVGTRVSFGQGVSGLVTARHVLTRLQKAQRPSVGNTTFKFPLDNSAVLVDSKQLDIAVIHLPEFLISEFGVSAIKLGVPVVGKTITIPFCDAGQELYTRGSVTAMRGAFLKHNASTIPSSSGAPIIQDGKLVGVHHTGRSGVYNVGSSVQFLSKAITKESASNEAAFRDGEVDVPDFEIDVRVKGSTHKLVTAGPFYDYAKFEKSKKAAGELLWADMDDDDEWDNYDPFEASLNGKGRDRTVLKETVKSAVAAAVAHNESLNCSGRVSGVSPTICNSRGPTETKEVREKVQASSTSVSSTTSPAPCQTGPIESDLGSTAQSPPLKSGAGQKQAPKGSSKASDGMPVTTNTVPNRNPTKSPPQSATSSQTTQGLPLRSGCVPAPLRSVLNSHGILCGRRRVYTYRPEIDICRAAGVTEDVLLEMEKYVQLVQSLPLKKPLTQRKPMPPRGSPGQNSRRQTPSSKQTQGSGKWSSGAPTTKS